MTAPPFQPDKVMPAQKPEYLATRLAYCRKMLYVWGFLTDAQNKRLQDKLPREVKG